MNKGARLAIVAGIIIAIGGAATFMAVSSQQPNDPVPSVDNGNNNTTNSEPRQITIDLNESLNVGVE